MTLVPTDTDTILLIGMLLGTVRVPDVAAVVCVVPSVRVNVVRLVDTVTAPEPKKVGLLPMLTLSVERLLELSKITLVSPEYWNAASSMLVTLDGIVTEVKLDAYWNAAYPILVTSAGIIMEVNFGDLNAPWLMLVNLEPSANVTDVNFDAPSNALSPMLVTLAGMIIEVKPA